jgi:hypothetical protein
MTRNTVSSILMFLALMLPCWAVGSRPAPQSDAGTAAIAGAIEQLVNRARAQNGLPPLLGVDYLAKAAVGHAEEMLTLDYFSHTSPVAARASVKQRIVLAGGWDTQTGENIYRCTGVDAGQVAERTVAAWLASPVHRKNIMQPAYNSQGVGVVRCGDTFSVTQNLSKQSIAVVRSLVTARGADVELVLAGRVRQGSQNLGVFVGGVLHSAPQVSADGHFEVKVTAPAGSVVSLGQEKAERSFSVTLLLPPLAATHHP